MKTIIVIGGGPSGMIAAGTAAENGNKVILFEKNPMLGKKLRITGKGRCNITNNADIEDILKAIPTNNKFLYSALYSFTNTDIINLLDRFGVKTKVERGGRIFPVSDNAHDVAEALRKYALNKNTTLKKDTVIEIIVKDKKVCGVKTLQKTYNCDSVILATGGASYPLTGSTGDGYKFAKKLGHTIVDIKPSLIPIVTNETWVKDIMGLSLKNVELSAYNSKGKKVYTDFGEMIFTHFGISGPIVLSTSAHLRKKDKYTIKIDLKPALQKEQLDARIRRDFEKNSKKHLINGLDELLPKALIPLVIKLSDIDPHKEISFITKEERARLVEILKGLSLTVKGFRPVEEAIVTSGGIKVSEINPHTMESKLVSGLFFAGEIIDVDAYTGGYNLQIAYSTGYLAGQNC